MAQGRRKSKVEFSDPASEVLLVKTLNLQVGFQQRPAAEAMKATVSLGA